MHAYDKDYLYHAQKNFGHMIDFAVNTCGIDIDEYFEMFFASSVCTQFENGNPAYIVGRTGCELARLVALEVKGEEIDEADVMYMDKSPVSTVANLAKALDCNPLDLLEINS